MISLTIMINPITLSLLYKDHARAAEARNAITNPVWPADGVTLIDDFGQEIFLTCKPSAVAWDDMDKSKSAQIERALHQARTQAEAQMIARSDPKLRNAMAGPSVIAPFGPGPN